MTRVLAHCCISSQVFTTCYALNARDSIEESSLLEKNCECNVTFEQYHAYTYQLSYKEVCKALCYITPGNTIEIANRLQRTDMQVS